MKPIITQPLNDNKKDKKKEQNKSFTKSERDKKRKKQITLAAKKCIAEKGFHATSIAQIAAVANMSVGLIYLYFQNKEAIIMAVVQDIIAEDLLNLEVNFGTIEVIADSNPQERAVMLEVYAEAARNPTIAKFLYETDHTMENKLKKIISEKYPQLSPGECHNYIEFMAILFGGTTMRYICKPKEVKAVFPLIDKVMTAVIPFLKKDE